MFIETYLRFLDQHLTLDWAAIFDSDLGHRLLEIDFSDLRERLRVRSEIPNYLSHRNTTRLHIGSCAAMSRPECIGPSKRRQVSLATREELWRESLNRPASDLWRLMLCFRSLAGNLTREIGVQLQMTSIGSCYAHVSERKINQSVGRHFS